jgi:hypothetical protein
MHTTTRTPAKHSGREQRGPGIRLRRTCIPHTARRSHCSRGTRLRCSLAHDRRTENQPTTSQAPTATLRGCGGTKPPQRAGAAALQGVWVGEAPHRGAAEGRAKNDDITNAKRRPRREQEAPIDGVETRGLEPLTPTLPGLGSG